MRRHKKRRGQVVVFYALMIPIFLFAGGVGLDLGWYYLNVSRLQNAADASVIAGAQALANDEANFKDFTYNALVDKYPADGRDYTKDTTAGDEAAAKYALKNLSSDAIYVHNGDVYSMKDNYTRGDPTITMTPSLYKDVHNNYYYVIALSENVHHFFLGFLKDMKAGVVAVARLDFHALPRPQGTGVEIEVPEGTNILAEMYKIEDVSVMRNWEWQDWYKRESVTYGQNLPAEYEYLRGQTVHPKADYKAMTKGKDIYSGDWQQIQDSDKRVHYKQGDHYRTETATVEPDSNENKRDSINLDFNPDLEAKFLSTGQFTEDWDIGYPTPDDIALYKLQNYRSSKEDSTAEYTFNLRIHSTFNFETPYKKRASSKYDTEKNPEDVLYVRIESEPINELPFVKNQSSKHTVYSTVRQIIININQSNMDSQYRPLMFFYSGPEKNITNENDPNFHIRDSQPIILNLNADARVNLFAPHSPVIINGNGYKMQGFVIAKEFVQLTTAADYTAFTEEVDGETITRYYDSSAKTKEYFLKEDEHGNNLFTDEFGNVQTKPLAADATRDPDYITKLKNDTEHSEDYLEQFANDKDYLAKLKADSNLSYASCSEMPERADVIADLNYEKVYKYTAFNLNANSYYDSFQLDSLKRKIYTYLDNYKDSSKQNSVDMFFTTTRSKWID
ncbi:MAG: Tad domain-containing protein [Selenomonadaceae bacterium]|nr:Tad domain-containing protein [Selenomonadaceae bacterium]